MAGYVARKGKRFRPFRVWYLPEGFQRRGGAAALYVEGLRIGEQRGHVVGMDAVSKSLRRHVLREKFRPGGVTCHTTPRRNEAQRIVPVHTWLASVEMFAAKIESRAARNFFVFHVCVL